MTVNYYARTPDGRCLYPVTIDGGRPPIPGEVEGVQRRHLGSSRYLALVVTDGPVDTLEAVRAHSERDGRWLLRADGLPERITAALPAELTDAEIEELRESDSELVRYYSPNHVRTEVPDPIDVSAWQPLPVGDDVVMAPRNWAPGALGTVLGPGLDVYAPGWLTGYRQAVVAMAKLLPGVIDVWEHLGDRHLECNVRSFYDPPKVATVKATGSGRRSAQQPGRQQWQTTRVKVDTPAQIGGATLAAAQAAWDATLAEARAALELVATAKVCAHCDGVGYILTVDRAVPS